MGIKRAKASLSLLSHKTFREGKLFVSTYKNFPMIAVPNNLGFCPVSSSSFSGDDRFPYGKSCFHKRFWPLVSLLVVNQFYADCFDILVLFFNKSQQI
ncbi:hypothetical protein AT5G42825 [Arabidopsis thaliana]|uniref:At5g42825 n=2 Tax=Arabidopsis thaliana TaxID=3702 RepID=Q94AK0_ARATH|nr:uncharacterized protein AT5G42825 [Arabidopsis thaliana]AAK76662.1 unknown protein [Arabidopsis thaliana]ABK32171.1 At5g42825 [Arabidopsis thaliana]AED94870.1 hypothetical protein AT5G42825 [Arabidopsis thaliana]|eukprot:NP_974871.1 hypothetical protein AT5G42825 [Arabidopsis thaliana]